MNISTVNELIASLESAGELSIREQKFLKLAKAFKQLAAENVALKAVFIQGEIPSEAVDAFMETAVMDHDWNETSEWSWVENETEVIHAVLGALKPETPATDRIVAEAEARGVEKFAAEQRGVAERLQKSNVAVAERSISFCLDSAEEAEVFAKQLREGAK
ncbi:TPA: hypothetical protein L9T70_004031 [Klebsiella pneumoniae]|uniref:hypothetical protein n=1 Tax=Klebsiella pneumoniae complex TaxID=3390273 RepID=UPI001BD91C5A|nr:MULTISPECIES: hypothetical protein [Klebsiella]MDQ5144803.1 hypothetical protein [Klebsiella pneumoniae]HBS5821059.1 hypothetical protein [Klebsiella variicola]MBT0593903.1 hypothetical protein [Klebsiella quasipneumoniae]MCB8422179.1 hypothetical protein [Klebsiella variicola subsp. variicola]MCB8442803.1 hypothetical protein [Klebsiella variicola subsp. variicola]